MRARRQPGRRHSIVLGAVGCLFWVSGTARAFEMPTLHSILPGIVPRPLLPRAIAAAATAQQTAIICGPALGGFLYVLGPSVVYILCTVVFVIAPLDELKFTRSHSPMDTC